MAFHSKYNFRNPSYTLYALEKDGRNQDECMDPGKPSMLYVGFTIIVPRHQLGVKWNQL